jgi:hypothetical protein
MWTDVALDPTAPALRSGRPQAPTASSGLITAIETYLTATNTEPKPFAWTATAEQILEKVRRGRVTLQAITN